MRSEQNVQLHWVVMVHFMARCAWLARPDPAQRLESFFYEARDGSRSTVFVPGLERGEVAERDRVCCDVRLGGAQPASRFQQRSDALGCPIEGGAHRSAYRWFCEEVAHAPPRGGL